YSPCYPLVLSFVMLPSPPATSPLSLHDALPIFRHDAIAVWLGEPHGEVAGPPLEQLAASRVRIAEHGVFDDLGEVGLESSDGIVDRKSTRLNSSHRTISYAVFCLKKKKIKQDIT